MKSFEGFKAEDNSNSMPTQLPAGTYVAAILGAKVEGTEPEQVLKIRVDVIEGDFAGFYTRLYEKQTSSADLQYQPKYKGVFTLNIPNANNSHRTMESFASSLTYSGC